MNMRTVIAYLSVDEDRAFDETDGPIDYVDKEAIKFIESGIYLDDACIADDDAEAPEERYLVYLARFAFDRLGGWEPGTNLVPLTFDEWKINNKEGI